MTDLITQMSDINSQSFVCIEEADAYTLTPNNALHIKANCNFTDQFGRGRRIGEEWLVKYDDTESYIPDVTEVMLIIVLDESCQRETMHFSSNSSYIHQCIKFTLKCIIGNLIFNRTNPV